MHTEMACKRLEMTLTGEENVKKNPHITNVGTFLVTFRFFRRRDAFATRARIIFLPRNCALRSCTRRRFINVSLTRSVGLKCGVVCCKHEIAPKMADGAMRTKVLQLLVLMWQVLMWLVEWGVGKWLFCTPLTTPMLLSPTGKFRKNNL